MKYENEDGCNKSDIRGSAEPFVKAPWLTRQFYVRTSIMPLTGFIAGLPRLSLCLSAGAAATLDSRWLIAQPNATALFVPGWFIFLIKFGRTNISTLDSQTWNTSSSFDAATDADMTLFVPFLTSSMCRPTDRLWWSSFNHKSVPYWMGYINPSSLLFYFLHSLFPYRPVLCLFP